jgi:hypothetical protein
MAYPPSAPGRRTRRRRWLFVALVLLIIISVVALAVRRRTEQRSVTDYLAVAEDVANTESEVAAGLADLIVSISNVARPELMNRLAMLGAQAVTATRALEAVAVPAPVAEAHGYLSVAVTSWGLALDGLDEAVIEVLDAAEGEPQAQLLASALDQLRVGDIAYAGFLAAVAEMDPELVSRDFHTFAFDGDYQAADLAVRLRSVFRLVSEHDISVVGHLDPEPVAFRDDDIPVIPFSDSFSVQAVIANDGNEPENDITVRFTITPADGGSDVTTAEQLIATLAPQQATTIVFDGIVLRPGGLYEVVVTADLGEDGDLENNMWRMVFYRNEDS